MGLGSKKKSASNPADLIRPAKKLKTANLSSKPGTSGSGAIKLSLKASRPTPSNHLRKKDKFVQYVPVVKDEEDDDDDEEVEEDEEEDDEDIESDTDAMAVVPDVKELTKKAKKPVVEIDWSEPDLMELINRMENAIPPKDGLKFESRVSKLNWDEVCFGDHTPEQCRIVWGSIQSRIRRYRLLKEVLEDAKEWLTKPWTNFYRSSRGNRHPDLPKRPLSTYMLFYLEKKDRVAKEKPNLEMTGVSKVIAEMYKGLSDKKKQKYTLMAANQRRVYEQKMEQFYRDYPGQIPKHSSAKESKSGRGVTLGPQKPTPPFKLFCNDKLRKHKDDPNLDKTAFLLKCKGQWKSLSDKKKADYINRVIEEENRYLDEVKTYVADNPDFVPGGLKSVLTKEERNLIEKVAGKPEKPPNSGYSLFSRLMLVSEEIKQTAPKERMVKISQLWKDMSEEDQSKYKEQVAHLLDQYKLEYATYLESLTEEKKAEELVKNQPKRKSLKGPRPPTVKRKKPAESVKRDVAKEVNPKKSNTLYKNEPAQPPVNVCLLYLENFMKTATHIPLAQREQKGSLAWQHVSEAEKAKLSKELDERKQQYIKNFEQFLKSLSQEELKEYSMMKASGRVPTEFSEDSGSESDSSSSSHSGSDSSHSSDSGNEDASSFGDDN